MKVVQESAFTRIYPFRSPDAEVSKYDCCVVLYPDRAAKIVWENAPLMELNAVQKLAEALLYAVEVSQKGLK
jgi:hypothetical protein